MKIKTITESLHDKYVIGEITLRQAAEKLCECGWTDGFIDLERTAKFIGVSNN